MKKIITILTAMFFSFALLNAKAAITHGSGSKARIQGSIWYDKNSNSFKDDSACETQTDNCGIRNFRVRLYSVDGNNYTLEANTTTDENASYSFDELSVDKKYTVVVVYPRNGATLVSHSVGSDNTIDSDVVAWIELLRDTNGTIIGEKKHRFDRNEILNLKAGDTATVDAGLVCCAKLVITNIKTEVNGEERNISKVRVDDNITWIFTVKNVSNDRNLTGYPIENVQINITGKNSAITCDPGTIEAGDTTTCEVTYKAQEGNNTIWAHASGEHEPNGHDCSGEVPSDYFGANPKIDIEKLTNGKDSDEAPGEKLGVGDKVTWTYIVKI